MNLAETAKIMAYSLNATAKIMTYSLYLNVCSSNTLTILYVLAINKVANSLAYPPDHLGGSRLFKPDK